MVLALVQLLVTNVFDIDDVLFLLQLRSMQQMLAEMQQKAATAAAANVSAQSELGPPPASKPPPPPVAARKRSFESQFNCFCCFSVLR